LVIHSAFAKVSQKHYKLKPNSTKTKNIKAQKLKKKKKKKFESKEEKEKEKENNNKLEIGRVDRHQERPINMIGGELVAIR
jgi:hypothetical protein